MEHSIQYCGEVITAELLMGADRHPVPGGAAVKYTADHYKITGTRLAMLLLLLELFWGPLPAWLLRGSVGCWWVAQIVRRLE